MSQKIRHGCWVHGKPVQGTWHRDLRTGVVSLSCPACGKLGSLKDHTIRADGSVYPSVVCPHETCGFHAYLTLRGWKDIRA